MSDFLHPDRDISRHGTDLPHWKQGEVMQFVTFRLADSMPESILRNWREERAVWRTRQPQPWSEATEREYHERFTAAIERWLDQGHGECILKNPEVRTHLEETLRFDEGSRATHLSWIIMPNHVHLLFKPLHPLEKLMQSWKGISARKIGKGSIWQKNYRDTLIRDAEHFANAVRYIRKNPTNLPQGTYSLWQSERAKAVP